MDVGADRWPAGSPGGAVRRYDQPCAGRALRLLEGFKGYLMTDDYAGYNALAARPGIERLACLAHARR